MATLAIALVRAWTRCYTARMDVRLRDIRRAEIESDLWESVDDARRRGSHLAGLEMLVRLVLGVPDDLLWRVEHAPAGQRSLRRAAWVLATGGALVAAGLAAIVLVNVSPPTPPAAPAMAVREAPPPPPPPPPPPRPRIGTPSRR